MRLVMDSFSDKEYSDVDGIRVRYDHGWYLCRPSNTETIIVMRAEGRSEESLKRILSDVGARLGSFIDLSSLK